jgi:hypothetical protein
MTDTRHSPEKAGTHDPSPGNLGQKKAEREETADKKLDHMGNKDKQSDASKTRNR